MQDLGAARIYAQALFAAAQKQTQLLACQQGLRQMTRSAQSETSLIKMLSHPMISAAEKQRLIHSVLGELATPLLERFILLLIAQHRLGLLPLIQMAFDEAFDRFQQVEPVHVRAAYPMSETQKEQLTLRLMHALNSKIRLEVRVAPELIGGFVAQTRDFILDRSVKGQLERMQHQIAT